MSKSASHNGLQASTSRPRSVRSVADLPAVWRRRARALAAHGARGPARTCLRLATELERSLRSAADDCLTLAEAAAESGYSQDRLRHLIAGGAVPNAGRKGSPRIKRADLPRKVKKRSTNGGGFDAHAAAMRLLNGGGDG